MKSRIMYVLVLIIAIFMFVWTGSKEAFFLFAFLVGIIPVFIIVNFLSAKKILVKATFIQGTTNINIEYENKGIFPVFYIETNIYLLNSYTDTAINFVHSKALLPRRKKSYIIPLKCDYCGRIEISISDSKCVDMLRLSKFRIKAGASGSAYVYPELIYENEDEIIKLARENTSTAVNYQNRKGNDITEILNIREYVKGDSMKSIHWKLSLKQKQKLVREFDMPVNQEVIVLFALSEKVKNQPQARHVLAQYVLGVVELLYSEQIFFDGVLINNKGITNKYTIDSEEAYEWYMLRMLDGELSFDINDVESYMLRADVSKKYSTIIMITDSEIVTEDYEQMGVTHIVADIEKNR